MTLTRLSQTQLNLLETCPPHFQQIFLDQLGTPIQPDQLIKGEWGNRFHQLMQQKELNLSIDNIFTEDSQLNHSIKALIEASPEIFESSENSWREAEHRRTLQIDNYLLTVIYDLLIVKEKEAQILDWKTYLQPENPQKLAKNWQTRLYLYVLTETSEYLPEELTMTYWFVKLPTKPQKITFSYNEKLHQKTKEDLNILLENLTQWIDNYSIEKVPFPHIPNCEKKCPFYNKKISTLYSYNNQEELLQSNWEILLNEIEEIPL